MFCKDNAWLSVGARAPMQLSRCWTEGGRGSKAGNGGVIKKHTFTASTAACHAIKEQSFFGEVTIYKTMGGVV